MAADSLGPHGEPQFDGQSKPRTAENLTLIGAYAARVGNRMVGTRSQRQALTVAQVWEGLEFVETDTDTEPWVCTDASGPTWAETPIIPAVATSGVFSPASGWGFSSGSNTGSQLFESIGDWLAYADVTIYRTGSAITIPSDGNLGNLTIGTLASAWQPPRKQPFCPGVNGRLAAVTANADGSVRLNAVSPGSSIATGDTISFCGLYRLAR